MIPSRLSIIYEILRKETREHLRTKRIVVFVLIFAIVFAVLAVYGNLITGGTSTDYTWEEGPNRTLAVVTSFASFLPAIFSIAMTYNSVSGERVNKSLILILSKPLDRSSVYIGKFLSSFLVISLIYLAVMSIGYGIAAGLYGGSVSTGDVVSAFTGIAIVILGIGVWVSFTLLFSSLLRNPTTSLVLLIILWLFILPIVSQAGFIYFAVSSSNQIEDQPVNIEVTMGSTGMTPPYDDIIFNSSVLGRPDEGVEITLTDETGAPYEDELPIQGPQTIFIDVPPGMYEWEAVDEEGGKVVAEGSLYVDGIHLLNVNVSAEKDGYYNDIGLFILNRTMPEMNASVVLRDSGGEVVSTAGGLLGTFGFQDVPEGEYLLEIKVENRTLATHEIHSYGEFKAKDFITVLTSEDEEFPEYVSYLYTLNPDNDHGVATQAIEEDGGGGSQILEIWEGVLALAIYFVVTFILGLLIFEKRDPN